MEMQIKDRRRKLERNPTKKRAWVNAFLCLQGEGILVNSNVYQSYETSKLHCMKREIFFFSFSPPGPVFEMSAVQKKLLHCC